MYMLAGYGTCSVANNIAFRKINVPDFEMIIRGAVISLIGLAVGTALRAIIQGRKCKSK